MDIVLSISDDLFLDKVWASILPVSAFTPPSSAFLQASLNSSSHLPIVASEATSKWSHLISYIPHPPLPAELESLALLSQPASAWPRDYVPRQLISLFSLTLVGVHILYFVFAWLSYKFIFNHEMMKHPRFLKNQVRQEIIHSLKAFPMMILLTLPWFQGEIMGYSKLYDNVEEYGWAYLIFSIVWFLVFTDFGIYWIHRWEHHPLWYKWLHKPHHKWIVPTPFASYAFHPLDGYFQSIPYHLFIYLFPLHRMLYLGLFVLVNFWSILIHDSDMITGHPLEKVINGPAHHTLHHLYFTVNYGQYFTWADRMGNSYRQPKSELDPLKEVHDAQKKEKQQ
ncbi:fatty acid hydroxylase [Wolfiporia cocos MD-104 SS10]|uniref:Fatty acid hydroxylase n=1 Tax=Wolfiporia cocos (strain MD-104) TaxID=742152 RepID=A0A2H3K152_WOLCO|nr:fatty acid hydroxylase [Wolfiporia cocos MD-104 SS10]